MRAQSLSKNLHLPEIGCKPRFGITSLHITITQYDPSFQEGKAAVHTGGAVEANIAVEQIHHKEI